MFLALQEALGVDITPVKADLRSSAPSGAVLARTKVNGPIVSEMELFYIPSQL
jgi:hypothetical protein